MSGLNPTITAGEARDAPAADVATCVAVVWLQAGEPEVTFEEMADLLRATLGVHEVTIASAPARLLVIRYRRDEIRPVQLLATLHHYGWEALLVGC